MNSFIESQISNSIWMSHSRKLDNLNNWLHEKGLRLGLVFKDFQDLTFKELLDKDKPFSIHHRYLQEVATEMYRKVYNNISRIQRLVQYNLINMD